MQTFEQKPNWIGDAVFLGFLLYLSYRTIFFISKIEYFLDYTVGLSLDIYFYYFNLIFHELFHLVFSIFGEFMHFLGGTLGEFIFPLMFLIYFIKERKSRGIFFVVWWVGFNVVTTAVYMQDAAELVMPMLFEGALHDWVYIFTRLNVLEQATGIGQVFLYLGQGLAVVSCVGFLSIILIRIIKKKYA